MITVCNRHQMPKVKFGTKVVYVGRGTPLGNEHRIKKGQGRNAVIKMYRKDLWRSPQNLFHGVKNPMSIEFKSLVETVRQGTDLYLVCSCAPKSCHADVIKKAIEWYIKENK